MPGGVFQVILYKVTDFRVLDLRAFFVLTPDLEGNPVDLEIGYLGGGGLADLFGPGEEVSLAHIAVIHNAVLRKGICNVAVAEV